ncbi:hypothetical protein N7507_006841 [Penicillium longicatenatum]|nr:hypothetical protein N7507_006841 [Penicillium longicatenatum]
MASVSFGDNNHGYQIRDNYGSINAVHLPPERPETPPCPLSTVPFARDPDFVSRDALLQQIHEKSLVPGSRIALVGLGGVGKSQLAIEYSYQVRATLPETWVLWVHASNAARFEQSFRDIANQVKLPGRQDPQANIFELVENWLRDGRRGRWILLLDNIDDPEFLRKSPATSLGDSKNGLTSTFTKPLLEYIPKGLHGSVIITSRTREVALNMVDYKDLIEVKPMEKSEALELLQRKLSQTEQGKLSQSEKCEESQRLVEELELMPLAIVQAASYIRNRAPRYSVSQYLRQFRRSDREAIKLLKIEAGLLYRDWEAKNSILVTWQISFDYIHQAKPSAAELLSLMSCFDRQGIPENIIQYRPPANDRSSPEPLGYITDSDDGETSESDIDPEFEDDIAMLRDYSFINVSENGTMFTMHRLVQLTTRAWLKSHGKLDQWREKFISILCEEFPNPQYENWMTCQLLFPHLKSAISQRPASHRSQQHWTFLLYRGAQYAWQSGDVTDMREFASESRKQGALLLGEEHEEVLRSKGILATAYYVEGRWQEAEQLFLEVIEASKLKFGEDDPFTLSNITNLAATYRKQGQWNKAEKLQLRIMETNKAVLGENHLETLSSISNLAATYQNQGRFEEAEALQIEALETTKAELGEDHPETLSGKADLVLTYFYQGLLIKAEHLCVQVIRARKTKLGEGHPDTLASIHNLASILLDQRRWEEAEQLLIPVIQARKAKLGDDHPDTLTSVANLALIYHKHGRLEEAEKLGILVLDIRKTKLGPSHPDTLISMANLALIYDDQGLWKESEHLKIQVMETSQANFGADHPSTLTSMASLAFTLWQQDRWEEAEQLEIQVVKTRKTKLGEDHPDTLLSMSNLAFTWRSLGHDVKSINLLRDCLAKREEILGPHHPDTLYTSELLLEWEMENASSNEKVWETDEEWETEEE